MQQPDPNPLAVATLAADSADRVQLGRITGTYGLQGWVKVHSDTSPRENITTYKRWWLEQSGQSRQVVVKSGRPQGKTIVAQLEGVGSVEEASALVGADISVERTAMPALADGEYYWTDLTGVHVRTLDGVDVGPVVRLFETGANDVVVVADRRPGVEGSNREVLVPWLVPDVITEVDLERRVITVDWDPDF